MTIAEYLQQNRRNGVTATILAMDCGVPVSTITRLAAFHNEPGLALAMRIVHATQGAVTLADMLKPNRSAKRRRRNFKMGKESK